MEPMSRIEFIKLFTKMRSNSFSCTIVAITKIIRLINNRLLYNVDIFQSDYLMQFFCN